MHLAFIMWILEVQIAALSCKTVYPLVIYISLKHKINLFDTHLNSEKEIQ
jgi:hypothetical protein